MKLYLNISQTHRNSFELTPNAVAVNPDWTLTIWWKIHYCSEDLFDQKYSKNNNIVK